MLSSRKYNRNKQTGPSSKSIWEQGLWIVGRPCFNGSAEQTVRLSIADPIVIGCIANTLFFVFEKVGRVIGSHDVLSKPIP
jgi:hypothetical protein